MDKTPQSSRKIGLPWSMIIGIGFGYALGQGFALKYLAAFVILGLVQFVRFALHSVQLWDMLDVLDDQEWKTEAEIVAELGALPKFKSPGRRTLLPFSVQANLRSMTHLGLLETQPRRQKREEEVPEYRLSGQGGEWRRRRKERAEKVERKAFHPPSMVPRPA